VTVNRLAGGITKELQRDIDRMKIEIVDRIVKNGFDKQIKTKRSVDALIRDTSEIQKRSLSLYQKELLSELRAFTGNEVEFQERLLSAAGQREIAKSAAIWSQVLAAPMLLTATKTSTILKAFMSDWSKAEQARVSKLIKFGIDQQYSAGKIAADISKDIDKRTRANSRAIVRTAINHSSTVARMKVDEANKDVTIGYKIVSVLDGRTSDFCKGIDGTIVKWSDRVRPVPPFHPNCRTFTISAINPELEIDEDQGTTDGQTYYNWLKGQGKTKGGRAFVGEVLGKKRAKLFLDGGLSAEDFKKLTTDELFIPISLEQLKKKDSLSLAFEKAGI
jgi:SPP1 gp7 family putative phage head morphogenesis protein